MAWVLYTAWRYGQEDPWTLYNGEAPPSPLPLRYRYFLMGCGLYASSEEREKIASMAGGEVKGGS